MNIHPPPSPASTASNDWHAPQKYRNYNQPPLPGSQGRRNLATPPTSGSSFGTAANMANGFNGRPGDYRGGPSPPNSIAARSSNGSSNDAAQRKKQSVMEENLYQHYKIIQRYLETTQRDEAAEGKPNRARDKLVRLTPIQFQELSTDVYDELRRRQVYYARQQNPNSPGAPDYLQPTQGFHPKRNQARQKLSTLPSGRFRALAADVFYELERRVPTFAGGDLARRGSPANSFRGPPSRSGTPNGMRPDSRGQIRRPPPRQGSVGGSTLNGYGQDGVNGPMQKSSQSNTIVPNKSYLVEDDDDVDGESLYGISSRRDTSNTNRSFGANEKFITDYQNKVEDLQGRVGELEKQVEEKNAVIETLEQGSQSRELEASEVRLQLRISGHLANSCQASEQWYNLRTDLEAKLAEAVALNSSLQSEINKAKELHEDTEQDLREQLDMMATQSGEDAEWKFKHNELLQQNDRLEQENQELQQDSQELQQELLEQQRVTDEVRREAVGFLAEMKTLSQKGNKGQEREEKLMQQVQSLEDQVAMWKNRYAESTAQSRSKAIDLAFQQPSVEKDASLLQPNGLIKDVHVIEFQVAIDEAIRMSRQDPKSLLTQMKSVVLSVKHITEDFASVDESDAKIAQLLTKISGTACNFITATKNYVFSGGLSPVSLLDAAASHLSAAIVDAVHKVKMHPSQNATPRVSSDTNGRPSQVYSAAGRSSTSESVYSQSTVTGTRTNEPQPLANGYPTTTNGAPVAVTNGIGRSTFNPPTPAYSSELQAKELAKLKVGQELCTFMFDVGTDATPDLSRRSILHPHRNHPAPRLRTSLHGRASGRADRHFCYQHCRDIYIKGFASRDRCRFSRLAASKHHRASGPRLGEFEGKAARG